MCPGILFKIAFGVTISFGINLFQRKNISIVVQVQSGLLDDWKKSCSIFMKHVKENFMLYRMILFYKNICPRILFKNAVCVTLSFGINLFQRKHFSIDVLSSKWSAGRLVRVLFYFLVACEREFMLYRNTLFLQKYESRNIVLKLPFE